MEPLRILGVTSDEESSNSPKSFLGSTDTSLLLNMAAGQDLLNEDDMKAQVAAASRKMLISGAQRHMGGLSNKSATEPQNAIDYPDGALHPSPPQQSPSPSASEGGSPSHTSCQDSGPVCQSEEHSSTEETEEIVEINGKMYKRRIKRRIVRKRQTVRTTTLIADPSHQIQDSPAASNSPLPALMLSPELNIDQSVSPNGSIHDTISPMKSLSSAPGLSSSSASVNKIQEFVGIPQSAREADNSSDETSIVPMNQYMYQFGQFDNVEPLVAVNFFEQVLATYQATWITADDLISPNSRSKTVAMSQTYEHTTPSGARVKTGTFVQQTRTFLKFPNGSSANADMDKFFENSRSMNQTPNSSVVIEELPNSPKEKEEASNPPSHFEDESSHSSTVHDPNAVVPRTETSPLPLPKTELPSSPSPADSSKTPLSTSTPLKTEDIPIAKQPESSETPLLPQLDSSYDFRGPWYTNLLEKLNPCPFMIMHTDVKDNEILVKAAPIDALIVYATSLGKKTDDHLFCESFLVTYRTFLEPQFLVAKLISRYDYFRSEEPLSQNIDVTVKTRVCSIVASFLIRVVSQLKSDLQPAVENQLLRFCQAVRSDRDERLADLLQDTINEQKNPTTSPDNSPIHSSTATIPSKPKKLVDFNPKSFADQMTYLESIVFNKIELKDMLDIKAVEKCRIPTLENCANHSNNVTRWTRTHLYYAAVGKSSDREKIFTKLFEIMECLHDMRNFSSYLAMLVAFLNVPDSLHTKKMKQKMERVREYMIPPSFSKYRQDLQQANMPFLPYLGLMLQHLIHLSAGNQLLDPPYTEPIERKPEYGPLVNYWRCWKHFLIINFFFMRDTFWQTKGRFRTKPDTEILQFINNFQTDLTTPELDTLFARLSRESKSRK